MQQGPRDCWWEKETEFKNTVLGPILIIGYAA
jgi:hypothetical protein